MRSLIRSHRVALPLAALAVAGGAVAAYGAAADEGAQYRTVAAQVGDVDQVLGLTGVVESSGRSDLAFGTDGTVAKVPVEQGDSVEKGDVIAVLDQTALRAAVDRAASDLASAKAQLADDRDAQTSAVSTATPSDAGSTSEPSAEPTAEPTRDTGSAPSPSKPAPQSDALAGLAVQQDAVIAAQSASSAALVTAEAALAAQAEACSPVEPVEPVEDDGEGATEEPTENLPPSEISEECNAALAAVQSAQSATAVAQGALQAALASLGATLTAALGAVATEEQSDAGAAPDGTPNGASGAEPAAAADSNGAATGADGGVVRTVTAATLAADQAAIDRAAAELAAARVSLRSAVVRAPADGEVVSLSVTRGAGVAGGDVVAVLVAPGLTTVALEVTATQAAQLSVDTTVEVTPAGATDALAGSIGRVENIPTAATTTGSDPTYAVDVVLDERDLSLPDGVPASVAVVVGSVDDVVVVPASAIVDGVVTVLEAGQTERIPVTTGIVGSTEVEIVDGLAAGAEVVLADLWAELPTGDTQVQGPTGVRFGDGGLPAGGPPSGGLPGR